MKEWIELKAYKNSSNRRELFRKENVIEVDELNKGADAKTIVCMRKQDGSVMDVYTETDYDEIKAQLTEPRRNVRELTETILEEISKVFREIEEGGCDITENDFKNRIRGKLLKRLSGED